MLYKRNQEQRITDILQVRILTTRSNIYIVVKQTIKMKLILFPPLEMEWPNST